MPTFKSLLDYNDPETRYIYSALIFGIIILTGGDIILGLTTSAYSFYLILFITMFVMFGIAFSPLNEYSRSAKIQIVTYGSMNAYWKLLLGIGIGALGGVLLGGKYLFGFEIFNLSILLPPTVAAVASVGSGFQSFVTDFMAPFIEETWRNAALIPTLMATITAIGIGPIMFFLGFIIALILISSYFWIGAIIAVLGFVIWIYYITRGRSGKPNTVSKIAMYGILITATIMGNIVWASLHVFSYGQQGITNLYGAILAVFMLGMLISVINFVLFRSIIPGLVMHSVLNGIIEGTATGTGPIVGAIISIFLIVYLIMIFKPRFVKDITSGISGARTLQMGGI